MQQIGLYIHRLRVFVQNERLELGPNPGQFDLGQVVRAFVQHHQGQPLEGVDRISRLTDIQVENDFVCGWIKYGSTGIASDIINPITNELELRRQRDFVEEIPLFFCFYIPEGEDTWYVVTQSFGNRSCSSSFNNAFFNFFRERSNFILQVQKVMPVDGLDLANRPVQKLTLVRRNVEGDEARNQIGNLARELKVSLSIAVDGRGALGVFDDIRDHIAGRGDIALMYNGIEFDEVQATVRIGNSYRKVGLVGASNNAGVVDVSDDVDRDGDDHPIYQSIRDKSREICEEYLAEYRDT
ncbi:hypothetical protein [Yoonia sp.]|uniref:hypothetical protein n=1 Tax=Yoonia sp. TaxID=2212373 RepID=UPI003F6EA2DC